MLAMTNVPIIRTGSNYNNILRCGLHVGCGSITVTVYMCVPTAPLPPTLPTLARRVRLGMRLALAGGFRRHDVGHEGWRGAADGRKAHDSATSPCVRAEGESKVSSLGSPNASVGQALPSKCATVG